jgi:hypothetical protein
MFILGFMLASALDLLLVVALRKKFITALMVLP